MSRNKPNNESASNSEQFSGILVTLKKREQIPIHTDDESFGYTIFGHYDGLEISHVDQWIDFLPRNVEKKQGELLLTDNILDIYTLRACEPLPDQKDKLVKDGFFYKDWNDTTEFPAEIQAAYPLIACSLIHLSEEFVKEYNIDVIINKIATKIKGEKSVEETKKLHCGIYFSIGYSDIIILFRINDLKLVDDAIRRLDNSDYLVEKIISDSYTLTGFKNKIFSNLDAVKEALKQKNNRVRKKFAVSFVLRNNIDVGEFTAYLRHEIDDLCKRLELSEYASSSVGKAYSVFGSADVVVELYLPIYAYIALYMGDKSDPTPFSIKHNLHNIATIQSAVMIPMPIETLPKDISRIHDILVVDANGGYSEKFNDDIDNFINFTHKHAITHRNVVALNQLIKTYDNLVLAEHGFEIKSIIGSAFVAFFANLKSCMQSIDRKYDVYNKLEADEITNDKKELYHKYINEIDNLLKTIDIFRNYMSAYLGDLLRSDRSFIEGRTMNHPSIGSLTKLLFGYNWYINELVKTIEEDNSKNYAFVVVSGGCDNVEVNEIFSHIRYHDNYKRLFIITLPEICLFDFRGTFLGLAHECFHCIGSKKRQERYKCLAKTVCGYIAHTISDVILKESVPKKELLNADKWDSIVNYANTLRSKLYKVLFENLWNLVGKLVELKIRDIDDSSNKIRYETSINNVNETINMCLPQGTEHLENRDKNFYQYACREIYIILQELYNYLLAPEMVCSWENQIDLSEMLANINYFINHDVKAEDFQSDFVIVIKKLFITLSSPHELDALEKYEIALSAKAKDKDKETHSLKPYNIASYRDMTRIIMDTACECYADCMSIKILEAHLSDFLLCLIYQTWDFDRAFPYNVGTIMRIGLDLKLMYKIEGCLNKTDIKKIKDAVKKYRKNNLIGYESDAQEENDLDADQLIDRINTILSEYKDKYQYMEPIEHYIDMCTKNMTIKSDKYKNIKSIEEVGGESVFGFIDLWRHFAEGDNNASSK